MSERRVGQDRPDPSETLADGLHELTEEVLPALVARLRASRLGELEVRSAGWRVRLRRDGRPARTSGPAGAAPREAEPDRADGGVARSTAVGYFLPADDLVVGTSVRAGDLLGVVDVLGISQEVTAPADGIISRVLAEAGQAVEYGQTLAQIEPLEMDLLDMDLPEGEPVPAAAADDASGPSNDEADGT